MTNSSKDSGDNLEGDFQLAAPEGQTPAEILNERGSCQLPLPAQDKTAMELAIKRNQQRRFSLFELMAALTTFGILMGASNWMPLEVFALIVGIATLIAVTAVCIYGISSRLTNILIGIALATYIAVAVTAAWRIAA